MKIIKLLFCLGFSFNLLGQSQRLEVKGYGQLSAEPDLGILLIEIETIQNEQGQVVSLLDSKFEKVVSYFEKIGYKRSDMKTVSYSVRENSVYGDRQNYDSGFIGNKKTVLEFENKKETISKIIDSFIADPIDIKFKFSFSVSNSKRERLRSDIIKIAISDAKQKAKLISDAAGQQLAKLVEIKYGTFPIERYYDDDSEGLFYKVSVMDQPTKSMGFEVKEIQFYDYVVLVYEFK